MDPDQAAYEQSDLGPQGLPLCLGYIDISDTVILLAI